MTDPYAGGGLDLLDGGAGNDVIHVSSGCNDENTIVFGRGSGHDRVVGDQYTHDGRTTAALTGLSLGEVSFSFADNESGGKDLIITIADTGETLTFLGGLHSYGDNPWNYTGSYFKGLQFADQYLDWNDLCLVKGWTETLQGSSENDELYAGYVSGGSTIHGFGGNDYIQGGQERDVIYGGDGDDRLHGDYGDDFLYGGDGHDTLAGGDGKNYLEGGAGDDTYLCSPWNWGGRDIVNNSGGGDDLLKIEYVNPTDLWFAQDSQDLNIRLIGGDYQITVRNWFAEGDYKIDTIVAGDYSVTESQVALMVQAMSIVGAPAGAEGYWTSEQREALEPVLAAYWQPTL